MHDPQHTALLARTFQAERDARAAEVNRNG